MKADALYMHNILEGEKQYVVPVFQRYYSWEEKHWNDLWGDILSLLEGEGISNEHFIGAFVCVAGKHTPKKVPDYILVDGQQRIATITILLCALRDLAEENGLQSKADEIQEKYIIDRHKSGLERYKVISRSRDRQALLNLLDRKSVNSEGKIAEAYQYFRREIADYIRDQPKEKIEKLFNIITKQLSLALITLSEDENPFAIFETLNERGLRLEESDLIRNFVFMQLPLERQDDFDSHEWTPFEKILDKTERYESINFTEFYRDYLMSNGEYVKRNEVYIQFKRRYKEKFARKEPRELVKDLKHYGRLYSFVLRPETVDERAIAEEMEKISCLDIGTSYPLLLYLYSRYERGILQRDDFLLLLRALGSFAIRRSICEESTRGYSRLFPKAIRNVEGDIRESILASLHDYGWPGDQEFTNALLRFGIYWREFDKCRLVLQELEKSYGHKEQVDLTAPSIQIEHVMPQTLTEEWKNELGDEHQQIHEKYLHTLGNLTLSGYNIELYNHRFTQKKQRLVRSNIQLNEYFSDIDTWDETAIRIRGQKLASEVAEIWPMVGS